MRRWSGRERAFSNVGFLRVTEQSAGEQGEGELWDRNHGATGENEGESEFFTITNTFGS